MNKFEIKYQGNLRTTATHLDSGSEINTDAPKDNHGLGEAFSPTDMVCSALASCILTIMAIAVEKNGINIKGTNAIVKKTMGNNPRKISKIDIELTFPMDYDEKTKELVIYHELAHDYFNAEHSNKRCDIMNSSVYDDCYQDKMRNMDLYLLVLGKKYLKW